MSRPSLAWESKMPVRGKVRETQSRALPALSPRQAELWEAYSLYRQLINIPPVLSPDVVVVLQEMEKWGVDVAIFKRLCLKLFRHGRVVSLRELWENFDTWLMLPEVWGPNVEAG